MTQEAVAPGLDRFLDELRQWAGQMNLVGSTDPEALRVHVEDSLAAAPHFGAAARVVDLGSGAGFPGIPLALARRDLQFTLVESRERRVHFLRHAVRTLELDCEIRRTRIEKEPDPSFDVALLRAVCPLEEAPLLAQPWLKPDGEIWIWTREEPESVGEALAGEISLGERGRILRVHGAAVSRGTQ